MEKTYEKHAYILDFIRGRPRTRPYRSGISIQVVGEDYFTLLEAVVKEDATLKLHDKVYVGKDAREEVTYIIGRISYNDLTTTAKMELNTAVDKIVHIHERKFIEFFNNAQAITPRMHSLELIPGIGKKYMWLILDEREKRPFKSFEDLQQRVNIPNPAKLITKRILEELAGESKYGLFTRSI